MATKYNIRYTGSIANEYLTSEYNNVITGSAPILNAYVTADEAADLILDYTNHFYQNTKSGQSIIDPTDLELEEI